MLYHNGEITTTSGRHKEGYNNYKVVNIHLDSVNTRRIPLKLVDHFPNFILLNYECKPRRSVSEGDEESCLDEDALYKGVFKGLNKVTHVFLQSHTLNTLKAFAFQGLDTLNALYLRNNQIRTIHKNAFLGIKNLANLSLSGNFLKEIPMETFDHVRHLVTLDLHGNALTKFPQELLKSKVELETLYLNHNRLRIIGQHLIDHLPKVTKVFMERNDCTNSSVFKKGDYSMLYNYRRLIQDCTVRGEKIKQLLKTNRGIRKEIKISKEKIDSERKTCKENKVQQLLEKIRDAEAELEDLESYREKYVKSPEKFKVGILRRSGNHNSSRMGESTTRKRMAQIYHENEAD